MIIRHSPAVPFGDGSVAFKPYVHDELEPVSRIAELHFQMRLAEEAGFDGIVMSEHHNGLIPGYVPNPLMTTVSALAELNRVWVAPCPLLLLLRPTLMVAEDIAWLNARFPGRVGAAFAAGYSSVDFALIDSTNEDLTARFARELSRITEILHGRDPHGLNNDAAVQRLEANPIPVLSAAVSSVATRRAAHIGCGLLTDPLISLSRASLLNRTYIEAGGTGPRVMTRRVWIGDPPLALLQSQLSNYRSVTNSTNVALAQQEWLPSERMIVSGSGKEVAAQLARAMRATKSTALTLRFHVPGLDTRQARAQLSRVGAEMLPYLYELLRVD